MLAYVKYTSVGFSYLQQTFPVSTVSRNVKAMCRY